MGCDRAEEPCRSPSLDRICSTTCALEPAWRGQAFREINTLASLRTASRGADFRRGQGTASETISAPGASLIRLATPGNLEQEFVC